MEVYRHNFLPNTSGKAESQVRPLLQVYWTMTWWITSDLEDDRGNKLQNLRDAAQGANEKLMEFYSRIEDAPVLANIIMGDWISNTTSYLEVALRSTLGLKSPQKKPEHQQDVRQDPKERTKHIHHALMVLALTCLIVAVGLCFVKEKPCCKAARQRVARQPFAVASVQLADMPRHAQGVSAASQAIQERRSQVHHYQGHDARISHAYHGGQL